jgi:hypothetical protein
MSGNLPVDAARIAEDIRALARLTDPGRPWTGRAFSPLLQGRAAELQGAGEAPSGILLRSDAVAALECDSEENINRQPAGNRDRVNDAPSNLWRRLAREPNSSRARTDGCPARRGRRNRHRWRVGTLASKSPSEADAPRVATVMEPPLKHPLPIRQITLRCEPKRSGPMPRLLRAGQGCAFKLPSVCHRVWWNRAYGGLT